MHPTRQPETLRFALALTGVIMIAAPVSAVEQEIASGPSIQIPARPPPATLQTRDIRPGTGMVATAGHSVVVHYVGVAWSTARRFDASWDRRQPFTFRLGAGQVIAGWEQGVTGMRVGGRREIIIPPALGYGSRGAGGSIGPNETLVFVVDLLSVQ